MTHTPNPSLTELLKYYRRATSEQKTIIRHILIHCLRTRTHTTTLTTTPRPTPAMLLFTFTTLMLAIAILQLVPPTLHPPTAHIIALGGSLSLHTTAASIAMLIKSF